MKRGYFLIPLISFCGVIVILTLANPENVFAFKPIGPTEAAAPGQPLEQRQDQQPDTTQESSLLVPTSSFLDYQNSTFGMSIEYPSNWTKYESQNGSSELIVQFTDKPQSGSNYEGEQSPLGPVAIKGGPFTLNPTTTDLSLWLQEQLNGFISELPSFELLEMKNTVINSHQQNIPATMTSYTYEDPLHGKVDAFILDIYKDGRAYSMEYSAEPEAYRRNLPILGYRI